jgi:hypothetical protein
MHYNEELCTTPVESYVLTMGENNKIVANKEVS